MKSAIEVRRTGLTHNINEMKRAFQLVASSLANKGVKVIFRGTACATDHETIYLPELSLLERQNMSDVEVKEAQDFLNAIRGFLMHEVGHILYTDREVFVEGAKVGELEKGAMNAVEDVRIEQRMSEAWRGAGVSLRDVNEWVNRKQQESFKPVINGVTGKEERTSIVSRTIAGIAAVARCGKDHWFYQGLDKETQELLTKFAPEIRAARNLEDTEEARDLGLRIVKKLRTMLEDEAEEEGEDESGGASADEGDEQEGPGEGDGQGDDQEGEGESDSDEEEDGEEGSGGNGDQGEESDDDAKEDKGGKGKPLSKEAKKQLKQAMADEAKAGAEVAKTTDKAAALSAQVHPDPASGKYLVYTTEYDKAEKATATSPRRYTEMMAEGRKHFGIMKRNLANVLKAKANVMTITELEEGELDTSLLYRLASGRSDKVFKEDVEQLDLNVGVVLLVNESGSMDHRDQTNMTRIQLASITAALMAEVLDSLHVPFACYGHTTANNATEVFWGASEQDREIFNRWGATTVAIYKDFDESFSATKARFPSMAARNNTHDAEGLIFAANKLIAQKGIERRIIMTIDDGEPYPNFPNASHYTYDAQGKYQNVMASSAAMRNLHTMLGRHQAYVKEVVGQLETMGIETLGMGMGTSAVSYYYKKWLAVHDVASFPVVALKELRKLLTNTK